MGNLGIVELDLESDSGWDAALAAHNAGVKRVNLTSSVAAIYGNDLPSGKTELDENV